MLNGVKRGFFSNECIHGRCANIAAPRPLPILRRKGSCTRWAYSSTRACRSRGTFPPPCIKLGVDSRISLNSKARYHPRLVGVSVSSVQVKESKYCGCYGPEPQDTVYESLSWSNFEDNP